jgi:hypothetical protein
MDRKAKRVLVATASTVLAATAFWISRPYGAKEVVAEYFRPTTVEKMPLPEGCAQTSETAPANLMRIVEYQKTFYHLTLQEVVVCRTARRFPQSEPGFTGAAFGEETRKRWLPLYVGCCSYQFRRHVTVVVADVNENGSVIVEAALVQSRWLYLQLNWRKDLSYWY